MLRSSTGWLVPVGVSDTTLCDDCIQSGVIFGIATYCTYDWAVHPVARLPCSVAAYYYEVGSACWLQLQERGLLSRVWLFGVSRDGVKVLNDSPRVHPQVQNPGALAVPLSSCAAFSFTRAFSKRHPLPPFLRRAF